MKTLEVPFSPTPELNSLLLDRGFEPLSTVFREWAHNNVPGKKGFQPKGSADFDTGVPAIPGSGNLDFALAIPAFQRYRELTTKYPDVKTRVVIATDQAPWTVAATRDEGRGSVIGLNAAQWNKGGWWGPGKSGSGYYIDPTPQGIMTHEFGHAVQHYLDTLPSSSPRAVAYHAWWSEQGRLKVLRDVSEYAAKGSPHEVFAEQFAFEHVNRPGPIAAVMAVPA